jgi:hypothetical protein
MWRRGKEEGGWRTRGARAQKRHWFAAHSLFPLRRSLEVDAVLPDRGPDHGGVGPVVAGGDNCPLGGLVTGHLELGYLGSRKGKRRRRRRSGFSVSFWVSFRSVIPSWQQHSPLGSSPRAPCSRPARWTLWRPALRQRGQQRAVPLGHPASERYVCVCVRGRDRSVKEGKAWRMRCAKDEGMGFESEGVAAHLGGNEGVELGGGCAARGGAAHCGRDRSGDGLLAGALRGEGKDERMRGV